MKTNQELAELAQTSLEALQSLAGIIPPLNIQFVCNNGDTTVKVEEAQVKIVLAHAFVRLGKISKLETAFPLIRYAHARKLKYINVGVETTINKTYLIPSINGQAYPEFKCEFTTFVLEHMQIHVTTISREAFVLRQTLAKAKTTMEAVRILMDHGKLFIGSIGSRKTNSGTDYQLIFEDVLTEDAKHIIGAFVDIKNDLRQYGFVLTYLEEVAQFMDAISCKAWLEQQINLVKQFEDENNLRDIYDSNGGCIPNYKDATKSIEIPLDSLLQTA